MSNDGAEKPSESNSPEQTSKQTGLSDALGLPLTISDGLTRDLIRQIEDRLPPTGGIEGIVKNIIKGAARITVNIADRTGHLDRITGAKNAASPEVIKENIFKR